MCYLRYTTDTLVKKDNRPSHIVERGVDAVIRYLRALAEDGEQESCRHRRPDNTCYVRTHCVHKKIIAFVVLKSDGVGYTRRHRHGGYACRTDERINFSFRDDVEQFADEQAADCGKHESCKTEEHDFERGQGEEGRADCGCTDGNAEEQRDDVHKRVLRGVAESFGYAAFTQEVAEHKTSEQRCNGRQKQ